MAAIHHYVPRFLLKNFCSGTKRKPWAYDKSTGKSFETSIHNVAGDRALKRCHACTSRCTLFWRESTSPTRQCPRVRMHWPERTNGLTVIVIGAG